MGARRRSRRALSTILVLGLCGTLSAQSEWSWKTGREALVKVARGNAEAAVRDIEKRLETKPDHAEALFCLAVAQAHRGDIASAVDCVRRSLEAGLPFERYVAGPDTLLRPLKETDEYRELASQQKVDCLIHGPIVGSVTDRTARVWVRTVQEARVQVIVRGPHGEARSEVISTAASHDRTGVVSLADLQPATEYEYRLVIDDAPCGDWQRFRTFPSAGRPARFAVAFGGGAAYTPEYERMFTTILQERPLAFLQLGDNVYVDQPERPEIQRYCYYRRQSSAPYRALTASTCVAAIWDDHDFVDNDGWGGPEIETPPWKRHVWKVFQENWNNPSYGGGSADPGCWFDFEIGDVHFIMLDCRYYRTNPRQPRPSMLGPVQLRWLFETLRSSRGTFKVICSSVPFASGVKPKSRDTWDGYLGEREEIFSFLERSGVEGVVLLAADRHRSDAWRIPRPGGYDFYEFMSSRLTNIHKHAVIPGSLFGFNEDRSFGLVQFDTDKPDPELTYRILTIDGKPVWELTLKRSQLEFRTRRF